MIIPLKAERFYTRFYTIISIFEISHYNLITGIVSFTWFPILIGAGSRSNMLLVSGFLDL